MAKIKLKPCKKCKSTDLQLWDCGYSTFNPGGGRCQNCGFEVREMLPWRSSDAKAKAKVWNAGQKLDDTEKLALERKKSTKLRQQIRKLGHDPII